MSRRSRLSGDYGGDEEEADTFELSSLLPEEDKNESLPTVKATKPLPRLQVAVLLLLYLSSPISVALVTPFMVQRIGSLGIAPAEVGYYLGLLDSLTYAGEALMVFQWGRLSDKFGRKPILMVCTMGLTCTLISFGLSTTYLQLAICRALEGLFNGNSGVTKAILAELSAGDEIQLARVFSLMPMAWAIGGSIGPPMGGFLANPSERFPRIFSGSLWREHPYFLACLSGVFFRIVGFTGILVYLKETLRSAKSITTNSTIKLSGDDEAEEPLFPSPPSRSVKDVAQSGLLTRRLVLVLANYGFLALLDSSLYALYPLLLASPIESGGLGFPPSTIGYIIGVSSLCHGLLQAFAFPSILKRWDAKNVFVASIIAYILLFALLPILHALASRAGRVTPLVWSLIVLAEVFIFSSYSAYSCMYIFLSQAAPTQSALGKTHGLGQTVSSIVGSLSPAGATSLIAVSLQHNLLGGTLGYFVMAGFGFASLGLTSFLVPSRRGSVSTPT